MNAALQLVDISKLGLNSKIKKFSYSFICGKGYSPPLGGRIAFCLQSDAANAPRLKVGFIIAYLEWVSKHARFMTKSEENLKKSVDSGFEICYNHFRQRHKFIGELCNGSTYDSDSYCLGSNPSSPAICLHGQAVKTLPSQGKIMGSIPIGGATKQNISFCFFIFQKNL